MSSNNIDNLKPLIEQIGTYDEQIKKLTAARDQLKKEIAPVLGKMGKVIAGDFEMEVKEIAGRRTLSKELLEADGIDVDRYMKQGAPYMRMSVKRVTVIE